MKKSTITIRIEDDLKQAFQNICTDTNTDMSDRLHAFIVSEIRAKNENVWKAHLENIIKELGYSNVEFTDEVRVPYKGKNYMMTSVHLSRTFTFKDFLEKNKDRKIFIKLGNEAFSSELRTIVI
jgi:hypothetical protein